jgi:epoxyqueuosine reductase
MRLLLHICCAPCTIFPLKALRKEAHEIKGLFFNPNIHPYQEYRERLDTLMQYASDQGLHVTTSKDYPMEDFFRGIVFREENRCYWCYHMRLSFVAHYAKHEGFEGFTTTLLYSRYQKHHWIKEIGENLAKEHAVLFYYRDFREGWDEGLKISKESGMYRQKYCGCIYSEKERFYRESSKTSGKANDIEQ